MNILDRIVEQKRKEVAALPATPVDENRLIQSMSFRGDTRDFVAALQSPAQGGIALIAEVKKASPSAGSIRADFDPVEIARKYEAAGANCLSVLTDEKFFQGSLRYLKEIRSVVKLPLLRKDFIIDERQLLEAIEWGADAVLLIVAILSDSELNRLHKQAIASGLAALVEVHDDSEFERALAIKPRLIGINNRNLKTFEVDLGTTERLANRLRKCPADRPMLVAESGIHTASDVQRLKRCGASAILVGESLMREKDVGEKIRQLLVSTA